MLLVTKTMEVGGIERTVVALARELEARGHQVWVISGGGYLTQELQAQGTPHHQAPLWLASPADILRSALLIRRTVARCGIELIHSFSATSSVAIYLGLSALGRDGQSPRRVAVVSSPMGLQNDAEEPGYITDWRNRLLLLGADRVLVISPEIRRQLQRLGAPERKLLDFNFVGFDSRRLRTDEAEVQALRNELGLAPGQRVVATIGALHPRKSHELFLEAARFVREVLPDVRFLVVGEGELRMALVRRAQRLELSDRVLFTGRRDDIARILAATDVYVKPGVVEGFIGITVLEAMALGRPVVAFETEDVKLAIEHGRTGLIVKRGDPKALAAGIVAVLTDADLARRLGEAGRALVRERFDFARLAERLERFYADLLGSALPSARV